jgi:hypothetical protein
VTKEKFDKILPFAWVCKFKRGEYIPSTYNFSYKKPKPVSNPDMHWVKPTYGELSRINELMLRDFKRQLK